MFSNYRWSSCDDWTLFESWCSCQAVATNCILKHCIIHREALAVKLLSSDKQRKTELESVLDIVVKTVNYIKCGGKGKSTRVFQKLCEEMDFDNVTVLLHTKVC